MSSASTDSDVEYDERQLRLMEEAIAAYERGVADLSSLVAGLEALLGCLRRADAEWKDRFQREWGQLEDIYSVATYRGCKKLDAQAMKDLGAAVKELKRLIGERLRHHGERASSP